MCTSNAFNGQEGPKRGTIFGKKKDTWSIEPRNIDNRLARNRTRYFNRHHHYQPPPISYRKEKINSELHLSERMVIDSRLFASASVHW